MEDKTLFTVNGAANRSEFDTLVDKYVLPLNHFANSIIGDRDAAKDVVQDAFVYVWENHRKLQNTLHMRNCLYLAVRNYSLNCMKKLSRSGQLSVNVYPTDDDISAWYIRTEAARLLKEAIDSLPVRTAEIIRLSLDGTRQEEIARRLGISLATVKAQKARGITKLREILGPLGYILAF